jgi:hypothetical protein
MSHICPVCGYPELSESAYNEDGGGNDEICASCGFQFGYSDRGYGIEDPETHQMHREWREKWIKGGMKWYSSFTIQSPRWNPIQQLRNIGVIMKK